MQASNVSDYFDSISEKEECACDLRALRIRHIPTKRIFVAYISVNEPDSSAGYAYPEDNLYLGFNLDNKTSKTIFESIKMVNAEKDASKKKAILAELHKTVLEFDARAKNN